MTTFDVSPPLFALDFETTGLSPRFDHVLEVGLVGPRSFQAIISDGRPSSPGAQAIHRIKKEDIQREGIPGQAAFAGLLKALGDGPVRIAAHHATFERGFSRTSSARTIRPFRAYPGPFHSPSAKLIRTIGSIA